MLYRSLAKGITVSQLCLGTLTIGPLQKCLAPAEGGRLIHYALEQGINFLDTAELYDNYEHIAQALSGWTSPVVIATKSYAYDAVSMAKSLEKARSELNRDYIDIFLLHEQESVHTMRGHADALHFLCEAKHKGLVRAIGVSTHYIAGVRAAASHPDIDVIHPLINYKAIGIPDGSAYEMARAIELAASVGKGIYAMKALAGGALYNYAYQAINYVRNLAGVSSVAIGMGSIADIDANVSLFTKGCFHEGYSPQGVGRRMLVEPWCEGCAQCAAVCPTKCITIDSGRATINHENCLLCTYCVAACPNFYLKVIEC